MIGVGITTEKNCLVDKIIGDEGTLQVFQRSVSSPSDYGEFVLYQSKSPADDFDFKDEVRDFIDFDVYGKYKMAADGVRQTDFGLVRRPCDPFPSTGFQMRMQ